MRKVFILLLVIFGVACKKADLVTVPETNEVAVTVPQYMPSGLPGHVAFGAEGDIARTDQFIAENEYQFQYLSGDIFASGWTTWNAPSGQFVRNYLAKMTQLGKMPIFTYYNLVPAKNRYEDPAFTNMNDADVMNKYFDDFKFLLQICNTWGRPVIIHYEPDLMGYMEIYKNDAVKSVIKVGASNNPEVAGFTNDAKGLCQAIVALRNKYAPNVLLGWHVSQWATGNNLIVDKHNPEQLATQTANFYKSLNAPFDLMFSEFADRDYGYDELINHKNNLEWSTIASAANGNLSDFDRFQRFLKAINQQTGRKIILWQIPMGNTITKSCNNTNGHYKDNRAEYFLQPVVQSGNTDKIIQYGQAGVIGFIFGRGSFSCTSYMDDQHDGITGASETADDDGGFLRKAIKTYYQQGSVPLP